MRLLSNVSPTPEQLPILINVDPGFSLIRGAAGSGKTTTALMRLRQLCRARVERQKRLGSDEPVRVMALTFNRTLRGYISQLVNEQVSTSDELSLTVETFSRWARNIVGIIGRGRIEQDKVDGKLRDLLSKASVSPENTAYFMDEVKYVIGRFPQDRRDRYLSVARSGRGIAPAVPRALRAKLLSEIIEPCEVWKSENGFMDWNDVAVEAGRARSAGYDVVVVDECQDLSANQIRAVMAHLKPDHTTTFIMDAAQRIYPQVFTWREIGINMRRVFALKSNYRNTAEIARLASSLVRGLPPDENAVPPDASSCQRNGERPQMVVGNFAAQLGYMLDRAQKFLDAGDTVAILHPTGAWTARNHVLRDYSQDGLAYRS